MPVDTKLRVGAVLFPGFELLDIYGPLEMLGNLREKVSITTLAERVGTVASHQGPKGVADVPLTESGEMDVVLIPGGWGTRQEIGNQPLLGQLHSLASRAQFVGTICTGSALLAATGLLDGQRATTNKRAFDWVASQRPEVNWVRRARWVEDGRFFSSSGVSAGMDMTLALIERLFGREQCLRVARYAEYTWHEDKDNDPFA